MFVRNIKNCKMLRTILYGKPQSSFGTGFPSELTTNLRAWYKLDEASGTRVDAVLGTNNLTPTGTVNQTTGKIDNAAVFPSPSNVNYLGGTTSANFGINQDFSIFGWVYFESGVGNYPFGKISGGNYDWLFGAVTNTSVQVVFNNGTVNNIFTGSTISTGTWHLLGFTHSVSAKRIRVYFNGLLYGTEHIYVPAVSDAAYQFYIGGGYVNDFQLRVDEVGVWQRELTGANITALYNAGNGITF